MEVHHHPKVEKKNFKEYFLEFIMIFLAVTLGFIAENIRESITEHHRAKEMAKFLINDLKSDTIEINHASKTMQEISDIADSVIKELNKPRNIRNDKVLSFNASVRLLGYDFFDPQMGTYEQIKNSEALVYFPQRLVSKMTFYEVDKNYILKMTNGDLDYYRRNIIPLCEKISNPRLLTAITNKEKYTGPSFVPPLDSDTEQLLIKRAFHINGAYKLEARIMRDHEKLAVDLMNALKKEYHLK